MKKYLFFIFTFILLVMLPSIYFSNKLTFTNVGDNITYIMQAESLYYDRDFKLEKKDFERMYGEYPQIVKKLPILSKKTTDGTIAFGKPVYITLYYALFTPIAHPVYRGLAANLILSLVLFMITAKVIKDKKLFVLFCVLMFFSQFHFYLPQIHPEIFTNVLVLVASLPLLLDSKNRWFYILSGFMGGILVFEKQMAVFFPLVTLFYLFIKNRNKSYIYLFSLISFLLVGFGINYVLHGDAIAYQGLRGLTKFDGNNMVFAPQGMIKPFTFPLAYVERFKEYFFGKIIGIFVYNPGFALFVSVFFYLVSKIKSKATKLTNLIAFLPVFFYLGIYFFAVDQAFSYGGATTIGNRYFFQIYFYVLLVAIMIFNKAVSKRTSKLIFYALAITVIIFSALIYRPFYRNYSRAIMDHFVIALNNEKTFGYFPLELSYYQVVLSDLVSENKIDDKIFILNNARAVVQEGNGKWLPSGVSKVIEISENGQYISPKRLDNPTNSKLKANFKYKIKNTVKLNHLYSKGPSVILFEIDCKGDQKMCALIKN